MNTATLKEANELIILILRVSGPINPKKLLKEIKFKDEREGI
jgi:hypothetical protein